jgi:glycosyltransferase involved in cell wall biosynthesis
MKTIGIVKVKNEEHIIQDTLDLWAEICDYIFVYNDCSTDSTVDLCEAHPAVSEIITTGIYDPDRLQAEYVNRQTLLESAQADNPDWIASFDADEHLFAFDPSMLKDPTIHVITAQWHDMYITPDDENLPINMYKQRKWCSVEYRQIPCFFRNNSVLKFDLPDQRIMHHKKIPYYRTNGVVQHWGKGLKHIWDRKCDYYGHEFGKYTEKWLDRIGCAVHKDFKSDDGNPLQLWPEILKRYLPLGPPIQRYLSKKVIPAHIPGKLEGYNKKLVEEQLYPWSPSKVPTDIVERKSPQKPIVCCIPRLNPEPKHLESWQEFYSENKLKHNLVPLISYNKALHHAQRLAVEHAKKIGASHILFTESDHWRYPMDGLDVLLEADKEVIGFRTYNRKYPYNNMCYRKKNPDVSLIWPEEEMKAKGGILESLEWHGKSNKTMKVDLLTWGFTLVKMSVFNKMEEAWGNVLVSQEDLIHLISNHAKPEDIEKVHKRLAKYTKKPLGLQPFRQWGPHPTDSFFCQYCEDLGIDRWVHFGGVIAHGQMHPNDIPKAIQLERLKNQPLQRMATLEDDYGNYRGPSTTQEQEFVSVSYNGQAHGGDGSPGPVNKSETGLKLTTEVL